MNKTFLYRILFLVLPYLAQGQDSFDLQVFKNQPINFQGTSGYDTNAIQVQEGRLVYKKIKVPSYQEGSDVNLKLRLNLKNWIWV